MNSRALAYLQLIRLPTVFTAMADILLGFVLTRGFLYGPNYDSPFGDFGWHEPVRFLQLLLASCCLYLSGMVFNDVFDRQQDAAERPGRPIPSGRVSVNSAVALAVGLMLAGLVAAARVSRVSLYVGLLLVLAILAYDSFLKRTPLGPLGMGSCRFLNVMLGASSLASDLPSLFVSPQLVAALGLGLYITGVTLFARTEAKTSRRGQLAFAQLVLNAGMIVLAWLMMTQPNQLHPSTHIPTVTLMLMVIAITINRRALTALRDPQPATVQTGIKVMLLSYVMLDATLTYWYLNNLSIGLYATWHGLAVAALVLPAMFLSRFIPMT